MKKVTFNHINKWIRLSQRPLKDKILEGFQAEYFDEFRHHYYRFFYHMVAEMKPKVALEIGIDHGHTVVHMAAGNPETIVIGLDQRKDCAKNAPHYPNAWYIYEDSTLPIAENAIAAIVEEHGEVGVVFQDSSHHYEASHREFEVFSQFLDKNAVWCCDDILDVFHDPLVDPPGKSMVEYFAELPGRKKQYPDLHYGSVIGVCLL